MGRMIDALKLLEDKAPRTPRGEAAESAVATAPPPLAEQSPVTEPPPVTEPSPPDDACACNDLHVAQEPHHAVNAPQPLRLRVFSASEADAARRATRRDPSQSESSQTAAPLHAPLCWPLVAASQPRDMEALALRILAQTAPGGPGSLVFASVGDDGASAAVVLGLAPEIARRIEGRVLAVDADAAEAILSRQLGAAPLAGLTEVACGEADWTELICETNIERLDVLPLRAAGHLEPERLDGLDAGRALAEMGMHYAVVLIDAGPAARRDAARLGRYCDGVCLAVRLGDAAKTAVEEAARALRLARAHLLGTIAVS